jgi:Permuted papain-like amidase enzyme, YaeF/YiiX, C92 family
MKRVIKIVSVTILIPPIVIFAFLTILNFTVVSAKDLPQLKTGDIIFQTSHSAQSLAILMASGSAYSHMGIIEIDTNNQAFVEEATGPVKLTPLDQWIKRGTGSRITIKRMNDLKPEEAIAVLKAAHNYDGLPYDIFFLTNKDAIYCSELVQLAFKEGAGIDLGTFEKVKSLNLDNFAARRLIKKRWRKYPLCQPAENETFETCFSKILEQDLITPSSISADKKLQTVYSNYGFLKE